MSLAIEVKDVAKVLIGGDWYEVIDDSFDVGAYEYRRGHVPAADSTAVTTAGFVFSALVGGEVLVVTGPLTTIQAVAKRPQR